MTEQGHLSVREVRNVTVLITDGGGRVYSLSANEPEHFDMGVRERPPSSLDFILDPVSDLLRQPSKREFYLDFLLTDDVTVNVTEPVSEAGARVDST